MDEQQNLAVRAMARVAAVRVLSDLWGRIGGSDGWMRFGVVSQGLRDVVVPTTGAAWQWCSVSVSMTPCGSTPRTWGARSGAGTSVGSVGGSSARDCSSARSSSAGPTTSRSRPSVSLPTAPSGGTRRHTSTSPSGAGGNPSAYLATGSVPSPRCEPAHTTAPSPMCSRWRWTTRSGGAHPAARTGCSSAPPQTG